MNIFRDHRAVYIVTGALLTTLVVTAGSILTYTLIAPEIEKRKDENNLDLAKDSLMDLNSHVMDLLAKGPKSTAIFTMVVPGGDISVDEDQNSVSYLTRTKVDYNPGSKSTLSVSRSTKDTLSMDSSLPVDLVSRYDNIKPGQYTVVLSFEKERLFRIEDWTLHKNTTFAGTVSSSTSNYYTSRLNETAIDWDINRDGDKNDVWRLYLSDPNEDYIFDSVAIHDAGGNLLEVLEEGDNFQLGSIPIMVYRVRERYVVFRYAQMKMVVK